MPVARTRYRKPKQPRGRETLSQPGMVTPLSQQGWLAAAAKPAQAQPARPGTGGGGAPAPRPSPTIPRTPQGEARRINADRLFGQAGTSHDEGVYQAALQYGDPALVSMYANMGFGPQVANPQGALQGIQRGEDLGVKNVGESRNTAGTFFSGGHATDVGNVRADAMGERAEALAAFKDAERRLNDVLAQADWDRNSEYGGASQDEISAWMATEPEATEAVPTSEEKAAGTSAPKKPKKKSKRRKPIGRRGYPGQKNAKGPKLIESKPTKKNKYKNKKGKGK